ncbi:MAG: VOC family protein [Bythopirellula sp.]|nr:VOC family protein [Bythopirellula sp.]
MNVNLADKIVADFENGKLSRRQLVARLMGLGAALAALENAANAQPIDAEKAIEPTFRATGLDHIALDVIDIPRSRDFYEQHLGMRVTRGDNEALFMGADGEFFLTLFRAEKPGLNHYCYGIKNFDAASAVASLRAAGINPRETGGRVYFPDPDGIEVQIARAR